MLITFNLDNFRSFKDPQLFSYSTSSDHTHEATHLIRTGMKAVPRVSKAAVVFGPNASGKTNLLLALAAFRDLVLYSTSYSDAQFKEIYTPFRFGSSSVGPTAFEIDLLLDRVRYRYSLSYDADRIRSERLLVYHTGKAQRWFERTFDASAQREEWAPFSPSFNGPREMWRKATRSKALFLTTAAQLNAEQLAPLMHWFEHGLDISFAADVPDLARVAAQIQDANFKMHALALLRALDIQVDDMRLTKRDLSKSDRESVHSMHKRHGTGNAGQPVEFRYAHVGSPAVWFEPDAEAAGVHRLFNLLGPLLSAIEHGKLLVIDEFDTSLHPLVARFLIQLINKPGVPGRRAQLLLTSHNTTLMDLDILRRDEIWLTHLDEERASILLPLKHSHPRKHELVGKCYLKGRYGAVPHIGSDAAAIALAEDFTSDMGTQHSAPPL
jgi:AAA15 family ATPase/GTPase